MVNGERQLDACKCISNEDKEILLEALDIRRIAGIKAATIVRLPELLERIESKLTKAEKMIETIKKIPVC